MGADDADLLLGAEATERSLRLRPLRDYRVISFATHAIVAGEIPGTTEPALILTPMDGASQVPENGLLTATKIANLGLDANLVILSACNTAAPDGRASGRGLSGTRGRVLLSGGPSNSCDAMGGVLLIEREAGFGSDSSIDQARLRRCGRRPAQRNARLHFGCGNGLARQSQILGGICDCRRRCGEPLRLYACC